MTGEDSIRSRHSGGPASTGQVPTFTHPATSPAAHSGGSVSDRKPPPATPISRCAAISAYFRPSSLLRSGARGPDHDGAGERLATAEQPTRWLPVRAGEVLGHHRLAELEEQFRVIVEQAGDAAAEMLFPLHRLVPGAVLGLAYPQRAGVR